MGLVDVQENERYLLWMAQLPGPQDQERSLIKVTHKKVPQQYSISISTTNVENLPTYLKYIYIRDPYLGTSLVVPRSWLD
jgi:hypothetical protein